MGRVFLILLGLLLLLVIGAGIYFAVSDAPAPRQPVEKVIPNEKLGA